MPIYDYHCEKCEFTFEDWHTRLDYDPEPCPKCGELSLRIPHMWQHLRNPGRTLPPKATRRFGESRRWHHKRARWS